MAKSIAEAATKIFEQLKALPAEERLRAVKAALMLLGEPAIEVPPQRAKHDGRTEHNEAVNGISEKATARIRKNGIDTDALEQTFHIDGGKVELIGESI